MASIQPGLAMNQAPYAPSLAARIQHFSKGQAEMKMHDTIIIYDNKPSPIKNEHLESMMQKGKREQATHECVL